MTLLTDIVSWTESLPIWQRDACRRLLQKEGGLDQVDYSELYLLLKKENDIKVDMEISSVPLTNGDLPDSLAHREMVVLLALRELENVNQISKDNTLCFSETGITVIFGGNGSGKSGYARVLKRACRSRDQSEPVHPNANDPLAGEKVPTAIFDVKINGVSEEVQWSRDVKPPDFLSTISVFDSKCARTYITLEQDVAYLPYGLDIVENLANQVLPKLLEQLEAEIAHINVDKLPFEHLINETEVGRVIANLSARSDENQISSLATLSDNEEKRISELDAALKETDPLTKARELRLSSNRLKAYSEKFVEPLKWVSVEAFETLRELWEKRKAAEDAETKAAHALRAGENLLLGTGDRAWKFLFEAARRFSIDVAYQGEEFPPSISNKLCPLCQNTLGDTGIQRLSRFDEFIKNDVAKAVELSRNAFETQMFKIKAADLKVSADQALCDELDLLDGSLVHAITDFQVSLNSRRDAVIRCLESQEWTDIPELIESPRARIRQLAAHQLRAFRTLERAADEEKRKALGKEMKELSAKKNFSKCLMAVLDLIRRMKMKAALEKCRSSLKTRPISEKSKEFASVAVTGELRKALDREFKELGIGHIRTRLKERSVRGKMYHQLILDVPTAIKVDEILSEGEQRAIALGSFFAELAISNHSCGIVFDDPVSSLDHWRRIAVAQRMVEEAKKRQVIVFTHDTSFLWQLRHEIEEEGIASSMLFLECQGGVPGCVNRGLPWDHQSWKERIDVLEKAKCRLSKSWPVYPGEKETGEMRHQYDLLRATLERVIQDVVFNGVVVRYRDWIRVNNLEGVVGFNRTECEAIIRLHKRCNDVVSAHDPSSAKAASIPTASDLENDISALKGVIDTIKKRQGNA